MPKIVNHDQRRAQLVGATWRIIARDGIESATMREIAAEAGFANGAVKPYFATKEELLTHAYVHVYEATNSRIAAATLGASGVAALRIFCKEVLPLDAERFSEARIVVAFWQRAIGDPERSCLHEQSVRRWTDTVLGYLAEARSVGDCGSHLDDEVLAGLIMNMLLGAQISAVLCPSPSLAAELKNQIDAVVHLVCDSDRDAMTTEPGGLDGARN
jgi:AcrR family transcriptional regulator